MIRAVDLVASQVWAIQEESLRTILAVAQRQNEAPEAVASKLGRPLENVFEARVRDDGACVIPITGPIFRRANLMTELSGATSIEMLARALGDALDDPQVARIVLEIDSPGGAIAGVGEFATMVRAACERKPVVAYVDGMGCSAAYWIACAAQEVVCSPSALLGSIGVIWSLQKGEDDEVHFVSSQSPDKRLNPDTKAGRTKIQAVVDDLASVFVGDVARYRGVSEEKVLTDFGQGGVMVGAAAVAAGLADRVGTEEDLLAELCERGRKATMRSYGAAANAQKGEEDEHMPTLWDSFKAWMEGQKAPEGAAPADAAPAATNDEAARLRAELEQERNARKALEARQTEAAKQTAAAREQQLHADAVAFADAEVKAQRALPAERNALVAQYLQAAQDDAAHPVAALAFGEGAEAFAATSRVEALKQTCAKRPSHNLTGEQLAAIPDDAVALPNKGKTPGADGKPAPMDTKTKNEMLAMTDYGRRVLEARQKGS